MGFFRGPSFLLALFVATGSQVTAVVRHLDSVSWSGVAFYIPVSRHALQEKLDQFHDDISGPRLYLPDHPVLPGLPQGTHPLYIEFGNITFEGGDPSNVDFHVGIPFLGQSPSGPLRYSLNVAIFHDRDHGLFPEYALIPFTPVDHIQLDGDKLVVSEGEDRVEIRYSMPARCDPPEPDVAANFEGYMNEDINFSPAEPTFEYCAHAPGSEDRRSCRGIGAVRDEVLGAFPNVCVHWGSRDGHPCQASVEVVGITEGFWEAIPITQEEGVQVFAAEGYVGNFDLNIKYPCV